MIVPKSRVRINGFATHEPITELAWPVDDALRLGEAAFATFAKCRWEIQPDLVDLTETELPRRVGAKDWKQFAKGTKYVFASKYIGEAEPIKVLSSQYVRGGGFHSTVDDEEVLEQPVTATCLGEAILRAFERCTSSMDRRK